RNNENEIVIEQRPNRGLLANMWQFPMANVREVGINQIEKWVKKEYGLDVQLGQKLGDVKHTFSHKIWELTIYEMTVVEKYDSDRLKHAIFARPDALTTYPFSVSQLKIMKLLHEIVN